MLTGKFSWPNGSYYKGQFEKNLFQGMGDFQWSDGRKYSGQWFTGNMKGFGMFFWPDGRSYEGNFESDKMTHQGLTDPKTGRRILATFSWPDKRQYKGDFQNGVQQGLGCLYGPDGSVMECGYWEDGKLVTSMEE